MSDWTADTIPVQQVSRLLVEAVLEAHPLPRRPDFDGAPLTLERLEDKKSWPNGGRQRKARAAWERFVAEANEAAERRNDALFRLLMARGVALEVPPLETWGADLAEAGIADGTVSASTLKLLYLDHILPSPDDKLALLGRAMEASGLQAAAVDAVRDLFRQALAAAKATGRA
jgi:hypothetical protein